MIVEYARYKIDAKRQKTFEGDCKRAGASLEASSHCLAYELSHCTEDLDYYVLRIEWDSEEGHLKEFRASPEFKAFFSLVQPYVKNIEEMRHYHAIASSPTRKVMAGASSEIVLLRCWIWGPLINDRQPSIYPVSFCY